MKNQISFLTQFFIILLLCFALGPCMRTCTAHNKNDEPNKEKAKAYAPEVEPSIGFSPLMSPDSGSPTSSLSEEESDSFSSSGKNERSYTSFSTAFSTAFGDILKGTLRGKTITMPEHDPMAIDHHLVKDICSHTDYPDVCVSTITPFLGQNFDLMNILEAAIKACSYQANFTISVVAKHMKTSPEISAALEDCKEQYSDALENLQRAMEAIPSHDLGTVTVMLSAVMAEVSACESGFEEHKLASPMAHSEGMVSITASICLSIASLIPH